DAYYQTQLELIASRVLLARVADSLNLRQRPSLTPAPGPGPVGALVDRATELVGGPAAEAPRPPTSEEFLDDLARRIRIEPIKRSRLVRVTATMPDRELAAAIPNQIAQQYIEMTNSQRREASDAASRFLESHLGALRTRTEQASGVIQQFVEKNGIVPT